MNWERGYRCHGLWNGNQRLGCVTLSPPGTKPFEYGWFVDGTSLAGRVATLRQAKRMVEQRVRTHIADVDLIMSRPIPEQSKP